MSQPRFVTSPKHEQALGLVELPVSNSWTQPRAGKITPTDRSKRRLLGTPGPGQGYALRLIKEKFAKIVLSDGEEHEDVATGLSVIIGKRAASFGRSPISYDVDFFIQLFGFDGSPDNELLNFRTMFFKGAGHSYMVQRQLADAIPESTIKLTSDALSAVKHWRQLFRI